MASARRGRGSWLALASRAIVAWGPFRPTARALRTTANATTTDADTFVVATAARGLEVAILGPDLEDLAPPTAIDGPAPVEGGTPVAVATVEGAGVVHWAEPIGTGARPRRTRR